MSADAIVRVRSVFLNMKNLPWGKWFMGKTD